MSFSQAIGTGYRRRRSPGTCSAGLFCDWCAESKARWFVSDLAVKRTLLVWQKSKRKNGWKRPRKWCAIMWYVDEKAAPNRFGAYLLANARDEYASYFFLFFNDDFRRLISILYYGQRAEIREKTSRKREIITIGGETNIARDIFSADRSGLQISISVCI